MEIADFAADFERAAQRHDSWGRRPVNAYKPHPAPVLPGVHDKYCVEQGDDGVFRPPVYYRDDPEYRERAKDHWHGQIVAGIVTTPVTDWAKHIEAYARHLHCTETDLSDQENAEVMMRVVATLSARHEVVAKASEIQVAKAAYIPD